MKIGTGAAKSSQATSAPVTAQAPVSTQAATQAGTQAATQAVTSAPPATNTLEPTDAGPIDNAPKLAFTSNRSGQFEIYLMYPNGNGQRIITRSEGTNPVWSPDGTQIAFTSLRAGNLGIYLMDGKGGNIRRISDPSGIALDPAWSPNGRFIAYTWSPNANANLRIFVMDADG